ncbi:MAG: choice-of-anchor tandem repeat NxxGxxAF-containing protein [Phycisphaerales bacterium]
MSRSIGVSLACWAATWALGQSVQVRNLALSGQQAPGLAPGVTFSAFDGFSINANGRVGMFATITGPGVTVSNRQGIWWDVPGTLQLAMRLGDPAPGQPTFNYVSTTVPNLNDSGVMAYTASIAPTGGGIRESQWTIGPSTAPAAFAVGFIQVPGLEAGTLWSGFNLPHINSNGTMAFRAILAGVGAGNSHWVGIPSTLSLAARDASPTGVLPDVNFSGVLNDYAINSAGTYTFRTSLAGAGVTTSNNQALWSRSPSGELTLVARTGNQAPGFATGVVYSSIIAGPQIDRAGRIAFTTALTGPGISSTNDIAAWVYDAGATTLLIQESDQAPGLPAGVLFNSNFNVTFGGQSTLALQAQVRGPGVVTANRSGIWKRSGNGPLTLVARGGTPAPGVSPAANFDDLEGSTNIAMNASGRMMFAAPLANSNEGLWLEDATGALRLALLELTPFDVNDDPNITTLKTISSLAFPPKASDDDGRRSAFSDRGEVVFRLSFTDGTSGAFVAGLPQACDSIDFNNDTSFFDPQDIDAFLSVYSEGPCIPPTATCNDIDFNNDGSLFDPCDIDSFLLQFSEGPCTLCGQ